MKPELARGGEARSHFLREARAAAALRHDHIATIYQVGEDRGVLYLALELRPGAYTALELAAFTLGALDEEAQASLEAHVAACTSCQERAAVAPADSLVELLRRVDARADRVPE